MKIFKNLPILLLLLFFISCSNQKKSAELKIDVDNFLNKAMELHNIPGLALAVIKNDKVIYENYFGKASIENDSPVDKSTLFRIFSATKLITATGIFQLIQDGKLNLEDKISKYLNDLPDHWQNIRVKNLLSHSSGLPDIVRHKSTLSDKELLDKLAEDKMEFVTGNQFRYNQTNFWFLGKIIEKITGMTFDEFVLKNQFDNATNGILFSSNSQETIPNRAIRYIYNGKTKEFEKGTSNSGKRGFSGNGLNITLDKFTEWNKLLDSNQLLDEQTKYKMWTPFKFSNKKDTFLYGWGIYPVNKINSFGFSGGNLAAFRKFENHNTTIILLSNGNKIPAHDIIVNDIARIVIPEIKASILEEDIMNFVISNQYDKALTSFKKFKAENPNSNFKWDINNLGNIYLYDENNTEKAFQVFKFNAEANPDWWVSLAGLAEIYEIQKDSLKAIEHYKKAIILNKNNELNYNEQMKNKIEELKTN